jgi:hypothetical protein
VDAIRERPEQRPTARVVSLVEPSLAERLEALALEHDRSISGEIRAALRVWVADK